MTIYLIGFYFNILEIPIIAILLLIVANDIYRNGTKFYIQNNVSYRAFLIFSILYLAAILISSLNAHDLSLILKSFFKWIEIFFISILVFLFVINFNRFKIVYWLIFLSTIFTIFIFIYEILKGNYKVIYDRLLPAYNSLFALAFFIPFTILKNKRRHLFFTLLLIIYSIATLSRGVWIGLMVFVIYIFKYFKKKSLYKIAFCTVLIIFFSSIFLEPAKDLFSKRIKEVYSKENVSNIERQALIRNALIGFSSSPIWGVGSLNYPQFILREGLTQGLIAKDLSTIEPHNFFLQTLTEEGIIGFLFICFFFLNLFIILFKNNRINVSNKPFDYYLLGMRLFFIGMMINLLLGFVANDFRFNLAMFLGVSLSLTKSKNFV